MNINLRKQLLPELKLLFIVSTHGNEGFSIPVLKKLVTKYPRDEWGYDWIIGNPEALKQKKRFTQADLNRSAPGDLNSPLYEERRAAEIIEIAEGYDMIVDIHGTVSPCDMVKIISRPTVENLALTAIFPELVNIIWYSARSLKKGPTVQFMTKPAIELECAMTDPEIEEKLFQVLARALLMKREMSWIKLTATLAQQEWFQVTGRATSYDTQAKELQPLVTEQGTVYPFLTNQYRETPYYLLKRIKIEDTFLYQ